MDTIFITNDPWRAEVAQAAGVSRIMVDLEMLGKPERQGHLDTVISRHNLRDVARIRSVLLSSSLIVRVNPVNANSDEEIESVLKAGADIIMLPMFRHACEVRRFLSAVNGRAKTCLLFETGAALANIHDFIAFDSISEVHIGLNDLHLSLGLSFMFELLSGGVVEYMAGIFRKRNLQFGIGGVARLGRGVLPAELILSEHVRLGSSQVILSRDFAEIFKDRSPQESLRVFRDEMLRFNHHLECLRRLDEEALLMNAAKLRHAVSTIVENRLVSMNPPLNPALIAGISG